MHLSHMQYILVMTANMSANRQPTSSYVTDSCYGRLYTSTAVGSSCATTQHLNLDLTTEREAGLRFAVKHV